MRYAFIFCFLFALIYVIVKLLLEHQESEDKVKGIAQPHEAYTFKGMLKILIRERKMKRKKWKTPAFPQKDVQRRPSVGIRPFHYTEDTSDNDDINVT